jgi:hypothetical protein
MKDYMLSSSSFHAALEKVDQELITILIILKDWALKKYWDNSMKELFNEGVEVLFFRVGRFSGGSKDDAQN